MEKDICFLCRDTHSIRHTDGDKNVPGSAAPAVTERVIQIKKLRLLLWLRALHSSVDLKIKHLGSACAASSTCTTA